jgi:hypothetical protein
MPRVLIDENGEGQAFDFTGGANIGGGHSPLLLLMQEDGSLPPLAGLLARNRFSVSHWQSSCR